MAESAVVIVSILIAFSLDAWWDSHRDRAELADELRAFVSEIDVNLERLEFQIRLHSDALSSIDALTQLLQTSSDPTNTVAATILNQAIAFAPSYDPSTRALEAFVGRGGIQSPGSATTTAA